MGSIEFLPNPSSKSKTERAADEILLRFGVEMLEAFDRARRELGNAATAEAIVERMAVLLSGAQENLDQGKKDGLKNLLISHGL